LDGKKTWPGPIYFKTRNYRPLEKLKFAKVTVQPLEIRKVRSSEKLMLAIAFSHMYGVYRYAAFQHVRECLYPGLDHLWGRRSIDAETQDLECRMCLEIIADYVPCFVAHRKGPKIQFNKAFVFLFMARAPAIARPCRLPSSELLEILGVKLFRRLFPRNPSAIAKLAVS
jgi:hypothetical protein